MRLFIAINLNAYTRLKLHHIQDELRFRSERGGFTLPENLHLTLAFLGERDAEQTASVKAMIDTICFNPFDIQIGHVGRFRRNSGDLLWAGVSPCKPLQDLHAELACNLVSVGFSLDKREYKPHITLGRKVVTSAAPWCIEPFRETVCKIDLMKSERIGGKLTYTAI